MESIKRLSIVSFVSVRNGCVFKGIEIQTQNTIHLKTQKNSSFFEELSVKQFRQTVSTLIEAIELRTTRKTDTIREEAQLKMIFQQYNPLTHVSKPLKTYLETLKWGILCLLLVSFDGSLKNSFFNGVKKIVTNSVLARLIQANHRVNSMKFENYHQMHSNC